ncbi:MAG: copper chaperone PCu(A)C [Pseudomonadota bacterium]
MSHPEVRVNGIDAGSLMPMAKRGFLMSMIVAFGLMALAIASAMEVKIGSLVVEGQSIRATVPTAKVAAGYLTIRNDGDSDDRLVGGSVNFAGMVDIHEMKVNDGVMTMRPLEGGLVIPAGKSVVLKPGAEHLMFMQLKEPMTKGEMRNVTLVFERAGKVEIMFPVGDLGGSHSDHGSQSDHGSHSDHSSHSNHGTTN